MSNVAEAFVPGHITGFFTTHEDPDPTKAGSQGGGVALSDGVSVTVRPADQLQITLNGKQVEMESVERVMRALQIEAEIQGVTDLPIGSGFGVSGAMALGAALATNSAFDRRLSMNELITIAHGAEVQAGTGLGDVVAQARGGVTIRLEPGGPQFYKLDGIPARERIEYHVIGQLSTGEVLSGETEQISQAGTQALSDVVSEPTMQRFMKASRRFSRESDLLTDSVRSVITDVTDAGGTAAMGMLGEMVFALDMGLSDAGYDPAVCHLHHAGALLEE